MEWALIVSLQWIIYGSVTAPTTNVVEGFQSSELCEKAAEAVRTEMNAPLQRIQTFGRVVCVQRKAAK